jgi:hypothetical protein
VSAATLLQTQKGLTLAVRYCGHWPTSATLPEYLIAAQRAEDEINRAITCWQRWRRRFDPDPNRLELGSDRTNVRHSVASCLLEGRNGAIRVLTGPMEGSA